MTASLKLSWKVTSHPLVKEATKSLNASSKPKQIFNEKYSPERRASTGTCSQAGAGCWRQGLGRAELLLSRDRDSAVEHTMDLPQVTFCHTQRPISIFIHTNGAEENINVKAKELNVKQGTSLLCSSFIPWDLSHGKSMKSCFSTQALLWVKKSAVTASECYLGMELKSCQIALWG